MRPEAWFTATGSYPTSIRAIRPKAFGPGGRWQKSGTGRRHRSRVRGACRARARGALVDAGTPRGLGEEGDRDRHEPRDLPGYAPDIPADRSTDRGVARIGPRRARRLHRQTRPEPGCTRLDRGARRCARRRARSRARRRRDPAHRESGRARAAVAVRHRGRRAVPRPAHRPSDRRRRVRAPAAADRDPRRRRLVGRTRDLARKRDGHRRSGTRTDASRGRGGGRRRQLRPGARDGIRAARAHPAAAGGAPNTRLADRLSLRVGRRGRERGAGLRLLRPRLAHVQARLLPGRARSHDRVRRPDGGGDGRRGLAKQANRGEEARAGRRALLREGAALEARADRPHRDLPRERLDHRVVRARASRWAR